MVCKPRTASLSQRYYQAKNEKDDKDQLRLLFIQFQKQLHSFLQSSFRQKESRCSCQKERGKKKPEME